MKSPLRRFVFVLFLLISVISGIVLMSRARMRSTFLDICDLVQEKFYSNDDKLAQWVNACEARAQSLSAFASRGQLLTAVQDQMDQMGVSHFMIYSPDEDRKLWKGEALETGLRARWMEDHLMIYQILPRSPASVAGFRLGDEILKISDHSIGDPETVSFQGGEYLLSRSGAKMRLRLQPAPIAIDFGPSMNRLDDHTGLLDLSSFRSEYFDHDGWLKFARGFAKYDRLVIDLRENAGGNFVAMLRVLSTMMCHPTLIGKLLQPRKGNLEPQPLADALDDSQQIEQMERDSTVLLQTYPDYGCYRGEVLVLVGPHTASVSEIFASAFFLRQHSKVWGQPTAGDVVMAIWYDLPNLGSGYSVSIPEALFVDPRGSALEGGGIEPDRELFDNVAVWRTGQDSWIRAALRSHN